VAFNLSAPLSKSPRSNVDVLHAVDDRATDESDESQYAVLAQAQWPGLELLLCREDIRRPTFWTIHQPRHTVIVHLSGTMRVLDTEIEGAGATHEPPAPGDIWLVPAGTRYASRARGQIISYVELRVSPDASVDLPESKSASLDDVAPRLGHRDEFLYYALARICSLVQRPDDLSAMMAERLQLVLRQHLFRDYRPAHNALSSARNRPALAKLVARRLGDHIETHLDQRIALADLASIADMSVHHLLVAFRRNFGTTPAQYVLAQRLRRARWRLLNGSEDIAEIAMACGFSSHSHLTSAFKRDIGITPRQFREGLRTRRTL